MPYGYRDDPILGPALAYWAEKRGVRSMPRKRDIDPTEIPAKVLPNVQLIDVVDGGARFRYRLVGTALVQANGKDYTGQRPEELLSADRVAFVLKIYRTVCEIKSPLFSRNRYHTARNRDLFTNRIYLPLSDDDGEVHYILGVLQFEASAALEGGAWGAGILDPADQYFEPIEMSGVAAAQRRPRRAVNWS